jgi:NADH-quinone oxidoreductase subunit A
MNNNIMIFIETSLVRKDYFILFLFLIVAVVLATLAVCVSYFFARQNPESEKLSAYECGYEPYEDTRSTFDIKFCVVAILFIIFDIEFMFLIPWCLSLSKLDLLAFWSMMDFLLELGVGFFYVWYAGALDWK